MKNLASSDSRGYDLQKETIVKVTHKVTNQVKENHPHPLVVLSHLNKIVKLIYSGSFLSKHFLYPSKALLLSHV